MSPDTETERSVEDSTELSAEHIVRHAGRRALGSSQRLRRLAIVLWSAFLGATCLLIAWLALGHRFNEEPLTLGHTSAVFFIAWALALIPAGMAVLLATRGEPRSDAEESSGSAH